MSKSSPYSSIIHLHEDRGPVLEAQLGTISSHLRIHSILSPAEPEPDELSGTSSNPPTPKRKFEEAFSPPAAGPAASNRRELLDGPHPRTGSGGTEAEMRQISESRAPNPPSSQDGKKSVKMRPPMRSSIACMRCRRSKIKCDNDGGNSPCETCIKAGHKCQYPEATQPPKRNDPQTGKQDRENAHERKRVKKIEDIPVFSSEKSAIYAEEVLSYPFLTSDVWDQLLDIYRLHFATELPFLHLPTLKEKMSRRQGKDSEPSSELNLVLLGILALTARFHPDLVKYISHLSTPQGSSARPHASQPRFEPLSASTFFANALSTALGPLKTAMTVVSVERVQAFLMLGLFEWSRRDPESGSGAWMYIGTAIRIAQILRLGLDDKAWKSQGNHLRKPTIPSSSSRGSSEIGIIREIRRRTMFSCLILDRLLACGHERVSIIRPEDLQIQLPCTDMAFDLALDVYTGFLRPPSDLPRQMVNDDGVLSRFIRLVDLWGSISSYSSTGGRLQERVPPWEDRSTFQRLRKTLGLLLLDLPDTFTLSRSNYYRHDNHQATNLYVSLHMLMSLCRIMLDREYLPFLPIRCSTPEGPLDPRLIFITQTPDGFWEEITETTFKAARDIIDLVEISREKLPYSSLTLFSVWTAGFMGIYAQHFPQMDINQRMVSQEDLDRRADGDLDVVKGTATGMAYQALHKISAYLPGANKYMDHFHEMDEYYAQALAQFQNPTVRHSILADEFPQERRLSLRFGDHTGGLNVDHADSSRAPKDPIMLAEDERFFQQREMFDRSQGAMMDRRSSISASENYQTGSDYARTPKSTPSLSFTAINNALTLPPISSQSIPPIQEPRKESFPSSEQPPACKFASIHPQSQLELTGLYAEESGQGMPRFSMDQITRLKSQRIATVLNDLQEFSGVGSLGGYMELH